MNNTIIDEDVKIVLDSDIEFERFYGKTVLISGANGYVPSYFAYTFMALNDTYDAGIKVIALCRNEIKAKERFAEFVERQDFEILVQDVRNPIETEEKIHFFIHAASPAGKKSRHDDPVNTFESNVLGLRNMLQVAIKNPCEAFLFLSSVDIYGDLPGQGRLCENQIGTVDLLNVRNAYSCGKRAAEIMSKAYQIEYELPVYIVRPFQIIGPGPDLTDGRLHIDFVSQILKSKKIVLKSDGSAVRSFMYITDAIKAMFVVMEKGNPGEAYNIVSESGEASVRELAEIFSSNAEADVEIEYDISQRTTIEVTEAKSIVIGDSTKLKNLGWSAQISLDEACKRMMNSYGVETK